MKGTNKYFSKGAKSVKKADYSYNGIPLKGRNSMPKESQLYPDEQNGIIDNWKDWSKLQSLDQIVPEMPIIGGKNGIKRYSRPNEPTQRLNYIRNVYPPEYQTNAFENPPFTNNSLPWYTDNMERTKQSNKKHQEKTDNQKLADNTKRKIDNPYYQIYDMAQRPYKQVNAENESSQFYQNMINPRKDNSQIKQYAEHYYNPSNMYARVNRDLSKLYVDLMTKLGYSKKIRPAYKDVMPVYKEKQKRSTFFDI